MEMAVSRNLPEDQQFTLRHLVEKVKTLGLVIDLTNTNRYYNGEELKRWGIKHCKILVEGGKVPNVSVVEKFCNAVDEFLMDSNNNDKLVGVHCTHGLNRTGYLVCRYLVDKMKFSPDDAINAFNEARGHGIEREAYLKGLKMTAKDAQKLKVKKSEQFNRGDGKFHQRRRSEDFRRNRQDFRAVLPNGPNRDFGFNRDFRPYHAFNQHQVFRGNQHSRPSRDFRRQESLMPDYHNYAGHVNHFNFTSNIRHQHFRPSNDFDFSRDLRERGQNFRPKSDLQQNQSRAAYQPRNHMSTERFVPNNGYDSQSASRFADMRRQTNSYQCFPPQNTRSDTFWQDTEPRSNRPLNDWYTG